MKTQSYAITCWHNSQFPGPKVPNTHHRAREAIEAILREGGKRLSFAAMAEKIRYELGFYGLSIVQRDGDFRLRPYQRFTKYVSPEPNTGCWLWLGTMTPSGYGIIGVHGQNIPAHRFSYETYKGAIRRRMTLDHLCGQPAWVNPDHLEPVSAAENSRRANIKRGLARAHIHALAMGEIAKRQKAA